MDERKAFEAHLLDYTERDIAYHERNKTQGLEFAWACWQAATVEERDRAIEAVKAAQLGIDGGLAIEAIRNV